MSFLEKKFNQNKMITTEIAVFNKEEFEEEIIDFFWKTVSKEKKIKVDGFSKEYALFTMEDIHFLVNHPNIPNNIRPGLASMMNKVQYVPKQHSQGISKYFFCIFF